MAHPDPTMTRGAVPSSRPLRTAYDTLVCGAAFLGVRTDERHGDAGKSPSADLVRHRLLGNRLRELDRFLSLLTDEAALLLGAPDHDAPAFARRRNTANKLRDVRGMMRVDCPDHERLRAIGRISACLHHCGGRAHAASLWDDLALGDPAARVARGATLALGGRTIGRIGGFYRATADALMREVAGQPPLP